MQGSQANPTSSSLASPDAADTNTDDDSQDNGAANQPAQKRRRTDDYRNVCTDRLFQILRMIKSPIGR